jgi:hypothetical protein
MRYLMPHESTPHYRALAIKLADAFANRKSLHLGAMSLRDFSAVTAAAKRLA